MVLGKDDHCRDLKTYHDFGCLRKKFSFKIRALMNSCTWISGLETISKNSLNHPILDVVGKEVFSVSISLSAAIRTGGSEFFEDDGSSDLELNLAFSSGGKFFHFSFIS